MNSTSAELPDMGVTMLTDLSLSSFLIVSLVILVVPGPGVVYVVARSVAQGYLAGLISAAGLSIGVLIHVAAALVGLTAMLLASTTAFAVMKYIGAVYLIYLGIQAIRSTRRVHPPTELSSQTGFRLFWDGVVVSALNPKIAVFFLAFLPQFVDTEASSVSSQILILGVLYACLAFVTDSCYGIIAVFLKNRLVANFSGRKIFQYIAGSLMIGLGLKTALDSQQP